MPTMTLQQFGQTVKAKHPEYADLSDEDVGKRVLAKFPEYQDMVGQGAPAQPSRLKKFQNEMDASVATPEDTKNNGLPGWVNQIGDAYYGVAQGVERPIIHPVDTVVGIGKSLLHPVDSLKSAWSNFKEQPGNTVGQIVGSAPIFAAAGELAGAGATNAARTVGNVAVKAGVPSRLYESALKPSTTLSAAKRASIVKTGLDEEIPVSKAGIEKIGDRISDLNQQIKDTIATDPTRPINTVPALRSLDSVRAKFANQVTPQPDLAEINQVESNFLNNPKIAPTGAGPGPSSLPASDAQAMKSGTYSALGDKAYGELKGANIESQKALARELKEEIARQFPEISAPNAAESKLFDLGPVLERAVNRGANHQIFSLGTPAMAGAGAVVTGDAKLGAIIGAMKMVIDNPIVKSKLAISLSRAAKIPIGSATARVNAYSASLAAYSAARGSANGDSSANPTTQQP